MNYLVGLPFAIFLLLRCAQRGCTKFLFGPFGVCVVDVECTILAVRTCAQSLKKNKYWEAVIAKEDPLLCFLVLL